MKMPSTNMPVSARAMYAANNDLPLPIVEPPKSNKKSPSTKGNQKGKNKKRKLQQMNGTKDHPRKKQKLSKSNEMPTVLSNPIKPRKKKNKLSNSSKNGSVLPVISTLKPTQELNSKNNKSKKSKQLKKRKKTSTDNTQNGVWLLNPKHPKDINALNKESSRVDGEQAFQFIIHPVKEKMFFTEYWEKKPLLIKRANPEYYKDIFSTYAFDKMLRDNNIQFTKNLDVTSYSGGVRETHNPEGRAIASVVWDYYDNGCSLRLLNPQTFHKSIWRLLSSLQECLGCFCGSNVYLTPPGTQGFAPHWDDIEAFILQLEGKKRWRVYKPSEELPRVSSRNLSQEEISEPLIDVVLEPGDLLYFPRGYIHQGNTVEDAHSLHITMSCYQKTSWADLLEKLIPQAVADAASEDVEFRRGLPLNYLDYMGIAHADVESPQRIAFLTQLNKLMNRLLDNYLPVDGAVDQMGKEFIHSALPPFITTKEASCTTFKGAEKWSKKHMRVVNRVELEPDTLVRLIKGNCIRLTMEEDVVKLYFTLENSREYKEYEPQYLEVETIHAPAIEALIHTYPNYLSIEDFALDSLEEKMVLANSLWERGLLMTDQVLSPHYD